MPIGGCQQARLTKEEGPSWEDASIVEQFSYHYLFNFVSNFSCVYISCDLIILSIFSQSWCLGQHTRIFDCGNAGMK